MKPTFSNGSPKRNWSAMLKNFRDVLQRTKKIGTKVLGATLAKTVSH